MDTDYLLNYVPKWPMYVHMFGAVFCLGASAIFHLFFIKSDYWLNTLAKLDYGGINILILGSAYPPIYYAMACSELHLMRNMILCGVTFICLLSFCCFMTDRFLRADLKLVRSVIFIALASAAASPFIYLSTTS